MWEPGAKVRALCPHCPPPSLPEGFPWPPSSSHLLSLRLLGTEKRTQVIPDAMAPTTKKIIVPEYTMLSGILCEGTADRSRASPVDPVNPSRTDGLLPFPLLFS
jgi:hypothetical protein